MIFEDCLVAALETVLDWDLPDELYSDAVTSQAAMLAGIEPEDDSWVGADAFVPTHTHLQPIPSRASRPTFQSHTPRRLYRSALLRRDTHVCHFTGNRNDINHDLQADPRGAARRLRAQGLRVGVFVHRRTDDLLDGFDAVARLQGRHVAVHRPVPNGLLHVPGLGRDVSCRQPERLQGEMSAEALGITACLYAYSHLSFGGNEICAEQYHLVRDYAMDHPEVREILAAID